jgi:2-C-methyl-D-erythritol 4-phosphate cytidylyltransferase/2-C-methyl-D-erythritol 2,4-cyclodiphosphate synthase
MEKSVVLITAAGSGTRMGGGKKKEYLLVNGKPVLEYSLEAFHRTGLFSLFVVTLPPGGETEARASLASWLSNPELAEKTLFTEGGVTRQSSVFRGLQFLEPYRPDIVLIHDGARPWVDTDIITAVHRGVKKHGACLPVLPSVDAIKQKDGLGFLTAHLKRQTLFGAQTPQGFRYPGILEAHGKASSDGREYVDDTEIYDAYIGRVAAVPGSAENIKITFPRDLKNSEENAEDVPERRGGSSMRTGFGYDIHRLVVNRKLLLGGAEVPSPVGEDGHSDGDVLIHAVIDALFGAAGLGDIGSHFPPSDARYKDISSRILLRRAAELIRNASWTIGNLDCTVVLEKPKIFPYRELIIKNLSDDLELPEDRISVKGKTKEEVDAVGAGKAVEAYASVLLYR